RRSAFWIGNNCWLIGSKASVKAVIDIKNRVNVKSQKAIIRIFAQLPKYSYNSFLTLNVDPILVRKLLYEYLRNYQNLCRNGLSLSLVMKKPKTKQLKKRIFIYNDKLLK